MDRAEKGTEAGSTTDKGSEQICLSCSLTTIGSEKSEDLVIIYALGIYQHSTRKVVSASCSKHLPHLTDL